MPANKKHLSSWSQRILKITAGLIGGYGVTTSLFIALSFWLDHVNMLMSLRFAGFLLWAFLMVFAFLSKNAWKIWGLYLILTLLFTLGIYLGQTYSPIL
ncbi:hypothetical protein MM239_08960 [Belliella sp. DSM 111904]|uniref:DUF3649 domain-containing protein n=1 Tax=Belliella filtrata TaxID=2923435 RepID=A0ABS9V0I2_9BACT|nr:hypothetical protein [Belliella filtrata]MCH7409523.1 hypothetical protein [Belliella filtrata]